MFLIVAAFVLTLIWVLYLTYYWEQLLRLKAQLTGGHVKKPLPPSAPFRIPWIDHTLGFVTGGRKYCLMLLQCCGAKVPILFNLVGAKIILISSPANIRAVLFNPHVFTTHKYRADFIKYALGLPPNAVELICADTSGPLREPLPGSNVPPHRRILRMQQENTFEFVSKAGLPHLLPKYTQNYEESVSATGIGYEWVEIPDLFIFLRDLAMDASVNTLCGKSFLEQSPGFSEALWTFDANVHFLYMNFPKWLRPQAAKARDEALESISRWRRTAIEKSRGKVFDDSQMFDDIWGSKIMRGRNEMYDKFPEFDERSRAGADLGVIWAANDNLAPITYWLLVAMLRDPSVRERCMAEMQRSQVPSHAEDALPKFDPSLLAKQPLLQSVFSEVLRHEVTIMLARSVDEDHDVGNYRIPKDSAVLISTHVEHMDRTRWETTRGGEFHPVEEFWPERFLDYNTDDGEPIFSLKGLEGTFIPFGIGHYMCPGRHFSTRAILSIASLLMSGFDIELRDANRWVDSTRDYRSFGYSTLRPGKKTPFRIRRKVVSKEGAV